MSRSKKPVDIPNWDAAIKVALKNYGKEPKTLKAAMEVLGYAAQLLIVSKQRKYGKDNILTFGHQGLVIRMNDKEQRLINHYFKNVELGEEGSLESYGDMAGYSFIGMMLELGWFNKLPLE